MEIGIKKEVIVNAKTLKIYLKVCDGFCAGLYDQDGVELKDYEGYVPDFMPGEHYGDYVDLQIDIDTGHILNWNSVRAEQIESFINGDDED